MKHRQVMGDGARADLRRRIAITYACLVGGNVAIWAWALVAFRSNAALVGTALLAYSFGLRHAFDADHIAAIDNVTRKLMQQGQRPVTVGLFFSLGHSTVVVALAIVIAATASALQAHCGQLKEVGGVVGAVVSSTFLFMIAAANAIILRGIWRQFQRVRAGGPPPSDDLDQWTGGGVLTRLLRRTFRLVERSWHMYPLGVLFGLGFDTATEVGLLGISAAAAVKGMPLWSILMFPGLFTAGMTLMDTTDGIVMLGAYRWAFVKPVRKLYYNLTITAVSVVAALVIGGIEALGLIGHQLKLGGCFWRAMGGLNDHFGELGYGIVGLFLVSWAVSVLIYRLRRFDALEQEAQVTSAHSIQPDGTRLRPERPEVRS